MPKILRWSLQTAMFVMVPVAGYISWLACQDGNWIATYLLSGASFMGAFIGWYLFE